MKCLLASAALAAAFLGISSRAYADSHYDIDGRPLYNSGGSAPIYLYLSTGPSQWALAVTTNTTLTVPPGTTLAQICVETAGVRYTDDGSNATTTNGIPVVPASSTLPNCFPYSGPISALKFTAISGSPTISVSYYKAR